jgi:hypothetical protein
MADTYENVKNSLIAILSDPDHKVSALRGKWGTGKTFLWKSIANHATYTTKPPIYVSLFGVKSIKELKLRIIESIGLSDNNAFKKIVNTGAGVTAGIIKRFTGYSAEDGMLLWVSIFVANRLVVIDDVERKHRSLDADEIMGFLSEYSQSHGTKFLVLLNIEKLHDDDEVLWATLHEKVIDGEVVLDPSAEEAFDVAAIGNADPAKDATRQACVILNLSNIRVIQRIIRVVKRIAEASNETCTDFERWVPSTVLLVAIHYRALENPPPYHYVQSFNALTRALKSHGAPGDENESAWAKRMIALGISSTDEFETVVVSYLRTGILDSAKIAAIFTQYNREKQNGDAYTLRRKFYTSWWWDPYVSDIDLKDQARALLSTVGTMSAKDVSDFVSFVAKLGDEQIVREALDTWLAGASDPDFPREDSDIWGVNYNNLHPEVAAKMKALNEIDHPPLNIYEAVERIIGNSGWGNREIDAFTNSTVSDYEATIRTLRLESLRTFLVQHVSWLSEDGEGGQFAIGTANFTAACKKISADDPAGRLTQMIRRTFNDSGKIGLLN